MARLHGKSGSIVWAAGFSQNIFAFQWNRGLETTDGTTFGAENKVTDGGLKTADGSYQCYVDDTVPLEDVGDTGTITLKSNASRNSAIKILVTGVSVQAGLGANQIATYNFVMSGDGASTDFAVN